MIVVVNADTGALAREVAGALARRIGVRPIDASGLAEDEVARRARASHACGGAAVVAGRFDAVAPLRALRLALASVTDEVYAFRIEGDGDAGAVARAAQRAAAARGDVGLVVEAAGRSAAELAGFVFDDLHAAVVLVDPDPSWPAVFERERAALGRALGPLALDVHHIGSTAVPGLCAKPILDVLVEVRLLDDSVECVASLASLGYAFVDYPGNVDRKFFRKGFPRTAHVHVVARGSRSAMDMLHLRDALRTYADLRDEYAALKRSLVSRGLGRAGYGAAKGELIGRALRRWRKAC